MDTVVVVDMAAVAVVVGIAGLDKLGVKATGNVIDAERIILPAEGDAMHAGQTRHPKEATAAEIGAMVGVVVVVVGEVVVIGAAGTTGVAEMIGVVEEARLPSSLATGTVQTAVPTTLPAEQPATSAMPPSERPKVELAWTLVMQYGRSLRLPCCARSACAGWLVWYGCCIQCMALASAWLGSCLVLVCFPRVWCWLCWLAAWVLIQLLRVWHLLQLWLEADWLWQVMERCDRLAAGCSGSCVIPHIL